MRLGFAVTVAAAGAAVAVALTLLAITQAGKANGNPMAIAAIVLQAVGFLGTGLGLVSAVGKFIKAGLTQTWSAVASNCLSFSNNLKSAFTKGKGLGVIGLVVAMVMSFANLIAQSALGVPAGSLAWDSALAGGIAGALAALLMFLLFTALGPIGSVIQAVFALVDMLVGLICNLTGAAEKAPTVAKWFCGGLTGLITNIFKTLIYSGNVIMDMQDEDRLQLRDSVST